MEHVEIARKIQAVIQEALAGLAKEEGIETLVMKVNIDNRGSKTFVDVFPEHVKQFTVMKYSPEGPSLTPLYNRMLHMWNEDNAKHGKKPEPVECACCDKSLVNQEAFPQDKHCFDWYCKECDTDAQKDRDRGFGFYEDSNYERKQMGLTN